MVADGSGVLVLVGGSGVLVGHDVTDGISVLVGIGVTEGVQVMVGVLVGSGVKVGSGVLLGKGVLVGGGGGEGVTVVVGVAVAVQVMIARGTAFLTIWQPFWKSITKPKSEFRASVKIPPPPQSPSKSICQTLAVPALKSRFPLQIVLES